MEFTCRELMPGVRQLGESEGSYCTLLTGTESAILFDTMSGLGDLRGYIGELCEFTPTVICSHAHFDHTGGNYQFDTIYLGRRELPLLELNKSYAPVLEKTLERDMGRMAQCLDPDRFLPIDPGTVFQLGGMTVEVVALPGHTPGGIGLLCRELRLLLVGDAISPQECILFPESLPLEQYDKLLTEAETLPFDFFIGSHFDSLFPKACIADFRRCVSLVGVSRGYRYSFPPLPQISGLVYISESHNRELGQPICIITKPDTPPLSH